MLHVQHNWKFQYFVDLKTDICKPNRIHACAGHNWYLLISHRAFRSPRRVPCRSEPNWLYLVSLSILLCLHSTNVSKSGMLAPNRNNIPVSQIHPCSIQEIKIEWINNKGLQCRLKAADRSNIRFSKLGSFILIPEGTLTINTTQLANNRTTKLTHISFYLYHDLQCRNSFQVVAVYYM